MLLVRPCWGCSGATQACARLCPCAPLMPAATPSLCWVQGVVHGALGSGSLMLSTFDDRSAARLVVKLDNVRWLAWDGALAEGRVAAMRLAVWSC